MILRTISSFGLFGLTFAFGGFLMVAIGMAVSGEWPWARSWASGPYALFGSIGLIGAMIFAISLVAA